MVGQILIWVKIYIKYFMPFLKRAGPGVLMILLLLIGLIMFMTGIYILIPPAACALKPPFTSCRIYDRHGELLSEIISSDYKTSRWVPLSQISRSLIICTVLKEDKRFFLHSGVDLFASCRALLQNIRHRSVVSGSSTITMQVAKFTLNFKQRGILTKLIEILYALKLEFHLDKTTILTIYLNRTPYGNMNYGIEAASQYYFNKKARDLSWGESAILTSIPRSPVRFDPYLNPDQVEYEKLSLLARLRTQGLIDETTYRIASVEKVLLSPARITVRAPHFVNYVQERLKVIGCINPVSVTTTIDCRLQENLEKICRTSIASLSGYNVRQASIVVLERKTGDILAMVGSRDYYDAREGQVNGCLAPRQPGSSIKPFLYALCLDQGVPLSALVPDTLWEFRLADGTWFAPRNFGNIYHGPTRVRDALGNSFNVPTVYLLERIGVPRFYQILKQLGFNELNQTAAHYGLALGLGAAEVDLLELTNAYRVLSLGGVYHPSRAILKITRDDRILIQPAVDRENGQRIFSAEAVNVITDILADNASRIKAFGDDSPLNMPFPCAVKTGTSKDYRDNWCVGYTTEYVTGVWVGNFDGSSMQGVSGVTGAAPLFRDIMVELHRAVRPSRFAAMPKIKKIRICGRSGLLASDQCLVQIDELFLPETEPTALCSICREDSRRLVYYGANGVTPDADRPFIILHPRDGDIFKIDPQITRRNQLITIRIQALSDLGGLKISIDDEPLGRIFYPYALDWPPRPGEHRLEVTGAGHTERVSFRIF